MHNQNQSLASASAVGARVRRGSTGDTKIVTEDTEDDHVQEMVTETKDTTALGATNMTIVNANTDIVIAIVSTAQGLDRDQSSAGDTRVVHQAEGGIEIVTDAAATIDASGDYNRARLSGRQWLFCTRIVIYPWALGSLSQLTTID